MKQASLFFSKNLIVITSFCFFVQQEIPLKRAHEEAAKAELGRARNKKQKIISTGNRKGFNPTERMYCVCKTPYDDTK